MGHLECRKPATPAGDGLSCAVLAERAETTETLAPSQYHPDPSPAERLARERWLARQCEERALSLDAAACQRQAESYRAAALRVKAAATSQREPASTHLLRLATSFDRRASIFAEAAR